MDKNCNNCKHHDVFWEGSGCNLLNSMESCKYESDSPFIVKQLLKQDKNGWVNVKTMLPPEDGWYMVYAPGYWGNNHLIDNLAISKFNQNYKVHWGIERGGSRGAAGCITHWMPLPKPPKGD